MKFETAAAANPIDQLKVVGQPTDRVDGPRKTTGTATYAYEQHDAAPDAAYGYICRSGRAKDRVTGVDLDEARASAGVLAIVTAKGAGDLDKGERNAAHLFGGP